MENDPVNLEEEMSFGSLGLFSDYLLSFSSSKSTKLTKDNRKTKKRLPKDEGSRTCNCRETLGKYYVNFC